ncbi:hypothetical protein T484DRAFT_1825026 [Baffinella frigidus]|nr:hypothetical protein T484DRAFT_1825026 [Cryptophyta sp. CCMP2293]
MLLILPTPLVFWHYFAYIRAGEKWAEFNDEVVSFVEEEKDEVVSFVEEEKVLAASGCDPTAGTLGSREC